MIQLHPDCLIFHTSEGELIPCSAEVVTVELVGESNLDPDVVREAAAAVVYYFKSELGREEVSVEEFSRALQRVLSNLGYDVSASDDPEMDPKAMIPIAGASVGEEVCTVANLPELATSSGKGFELVFFQRLRAELHEHLQQAPRVVRFEGLRTCVKQLTGRRRWCGRCQDLNDQIVDYLRECFTAEKAADCNLVVS
jgi:hypothetical protein